MIERVTPFLLVVLIFVTSAVYAEPSTTDQSKGIVTFPLDRTPVNVPLHEKPDAKSTQLGTLVINSKADPVHSFIYKQWEEENPDAGWFDDKTIMNKSFSPLKEYISSNNRVGPFVFDETPNWLRFQEGWMKKSALSPYDAVYASWNDMMQNDHFLEFHLPKDGNYTALGKLDDMRTSAIYSAFSPMNIYKSKGSTQRLMQADASLRFAIMGREGDWLNVFVVLNTCDARTGKRDYREGTNGWIPISQKSGQPSLIKRKEKC